MCCVQGVAGRGVLSVAMPSECFPKSVLCKKRE